MESTDGTTLGLLGKCRSRFRYVNEWILNRSPWGYAAVMASVLAAGSGIGIIIGRAVAGDRTPDMALLTFVGVGWLTAFLFMRLMAPAVLQGARLHQQWREERRRHDTHDAADS